MTTITRISVYTHCNDLGGKVWNPAIRWSHKYAVFVELESSSGTVGVGECWCFDNSPDSLVAFLRTEVAPHVLGMQLKEHSTLLANLRSRATLSARHGILASALSGVDIALWDIRSRQAGMPLWRYLKSHGCRSSMPEGCVYLYGSGGLYGEGKSTDDLVDELSGICSKGFDTVKMKIGALSIDEDIERVSAVLKGLDERAKLIIDGVYSYTQAQALQVFSAIESQRVIAFQSPLPSSDIAGMRELVKAGIPVMATEAEYREEVHAQLINRDTVKYLQTAPIALGGLSPLIDLVQVEDAIVPMLSLEVSSTALAMMAACHFAVASDSVAHTEYHFLHQVFFEQLDLRPIKGNPGWFQLPASMGLGFSLPTEQVELAFQQSSTKKNG